MTPQSQLIQASLWQMRDEGYKDFQCKLMPQISRDCVIGVRMPQLRSYAGQIAGTSMANAFLTALPHSYYEENNLHMALLEHIPHFDKALEELEKFLPYLDNWATCDSFCPKVLRKHPELLLSHIKAWLCSSHPYTVRYALVRLTAWYLDAPLFSTEILDLAADVKSDHYYVRMAVAWLFSIALVKQYDSTLPFFIHHRLSPWIHNKAIQKARESLRTSPMRKKQLSTLRINAERNSLL